jgi:HD-GYP domain-containing protein (c-di-GMP phosphodiesterase class II)
MLHITLINETGQASDDLARNLSGMARLTIEKFEVAISAPLNELTLIDINLSNLDRLLSLKKWLSRKNRDAKAIFITDELSRAQEIQIYAVGGNGLVSRQVDAARLLRIFADYPKMHLDDASISLMQKSQGLVVATDGLQNIFASASSGGIVDAAAIYAAGDTVISEISSQGLSRWIATVRMHHRQTYQHCLLVMSFAIAFGQKVGFGCNDIQRLSFAGMVHDIGKARIPLSILEKPSALDADEIEIMKMHPQHGFDLLLADSSFPAEMLDMVLHHHEYLDGSGYPNRLKGREISDLVRIITISDIFAALVEHRTYKSPLSGRNAYQALLDMNQKLDRDLVREFEFASHFDE